MREHADSGTGVWDGMRGIAILSVLVFHTWLFSWYTPALTIFGIDVPVAAPVRTGYLGVEIFFVISGFVLFLPYARSMFGGKPVASIGDFARRRFLKIVPSYAIALVVTVFSALGLPQKPASVVGPLLNHLFFFQNFYNDQFGAANSVFWSLAIEVQFYVIFPLVAWAFVRRAWIVAPLMIGIAIWYRYHVVPCCLQVEVVTRQLPAFLDLFACGMLAALVLTYLRSRPDSARFTTPWTIVAVLAVVAGWYLIASADGQTFVPAGKERWLVAHRTLFGGAVALFGVASSMAAPWWQRVVANRVLVALSLISYNLYLWHTLVLIWMWKHGIPAALTPDPHDDPNWKPVYIASGWFAAIAISTGITYFIERPLLSTVRRQPFSFDWRTVRLRRIEPSEKHI